MSRLKRIASLVVGLTALAGMPDIASAEWQANLHDKRQVKAEKALQEILERIPGSEFYLSQSYGFAILPSIGRIGIGFGGAYGRGIVVEGDNVVGTTSFWQLTSGLQAGAKYYSMIIFFKDKAALENYQSSAMQFMGQTSVALATVGVQSNPSYNDGVAIMTVNRFGLMAEFSYSGAKFRYKPLDEE